ncbi:hypothetical protein ACFYZ8_09360 [Streptomyces sp. NPDC001668]|uniref:hypothetical protein n=1 Tax=unclassified Streptomyces TaxID=2593676 RepID=UPI0036C2904F
MFHKVRAMASTWRLEVLMPETGQFLIGDNPAVTIRREGTNVSYGVAFGVANTLVLPIGPGHLLALGPENVMGTVSRSVVDELNTVHPRSGLEAFAQDAAQWRTVTDVSEGSTAGC